LVVSSVASWRRSCGEGVLMAKVDVAVAEIDVLRSCCWAGIGLLGAVTGVGWELGVPCRAPPLSDTQCVSVATQPCAVDRRVVWLLVAPALFGGPPCHPIISGVVLAAEVFEGSKIVTVDAGGHIMAVGVNGALWAWGFGSSGQLGLAKPIKAAAVPTMVGAEEVLRTIACGNDHTYG